MPLLQYVCPVCKHQFDELVKKHDDTVLCPLCKAKAERSYSGTVYSATGATQHKCSGNCKTCGGCH